MCHNQFKLTVLVSAFTLDWPQPIILSDSNVAHHAIHVNVLAIDNVTHNYEMDSR